MPRTRWKNAAVELLTEVSILGPLIKSRIDNARPQGLNECQLALLMILARNDGVAMTQSAIVWMLEDDHPDVEADIALGIAEELIAVEHAPNDLELLLTQKGKSTCESAIKSLLPEFEPALDGVAVEALEQAMETLREIRRTLDNLPT